jgi:O-antigen ligase
MSEILSIIIFGLATIGIVLFIGLVLHRGYKVDKCLIPYIFYPIFFGLILETLLSARNFYLSQELVGINLAHVTEKNPIDIWFGRAQSLFIIFASCEPIIWRLLHLRGEISAPIPLILAFGGFFLTNVLCSAFLGTHTSFSHDYIYMYLAGNAALLISCKEGDTAIRSCRNSLFTLIIIGAVCIIWRPEMVLLHDYKGLIPGLSIRYSGLSIHPNAYAPVVVLFLLTLWSKPFNVYWANLISWLIGSLSLLLTQSKTNLIAFALCVLFICYYRYGDIIKRRIFDFRQFHLSVFFLLMFMMLTFVVGVYFMFGGVSESIESFFLTEAGGDLMSFTGRDVIWGIAIQEWHSNPLFGYGLTIWDDDYRRKIGMPWATSAHSQFYQSLSSAGIIGVAGLFVYGLFLFWYALKTARLSQGLTMSLFVLIITQSISEIPLSMISIGSGVVPHLLLLMVIAANLNTMKIVKSEKEANLLPPSFLYKGFK